MFTKIVLFFVILKLEISLAIPGSKWRKIETERGLTNNYAGPGKGERVYLPL